MALTVKQLVDSGFTIEMAKRIIAAQKVKKS